MKKTFPFTLMLGTSLLAACGSDHPTPSDNQTPPPENMISFTVSAEKLLLTDKVMVDINVVQRGTDTAALTSQVNTTTAEVMKIARETPDVESKTGAFMTSPSYNATSSYSYNPSPVPATPDVTTPPAQQEWEVSQGIHLESKNPKTLSELIAKFQSKIQVSSINYDLSSATATAAKQEMTSAAVKAFRERAQAVAKDMGYDHYRISSMNIQAWDDNLPPGGAYYSYGGSPAPVSASGSTTASGSGNLVLEGGKQMYRLSVMGTITVPDK